MKRSGAGLGSPVFAGFLEFSWNEQLRVAVVVGCMERLRTLDMERLQREADSLREQIRDEQRRRQSRVSDLSEQLRGVEGSLTL